MTAAPPRRRGCRRPRTRRCCPDGSFLIADTANHRIRHVGLDGRIRTVAGTTRGFSGDGGPATAAQLDAPSDIAVLTTGGYVIADTANNRLRRVDLAGNITTLAGTGPGLSGDGDPARNAQLRQPISVAGLPNGGVLVADTANNRVRRVTPLGAIIAVAGSTGGNSGNGGPAKGAQLSQPNAVTTAPGGGFAVTDTANATVRRVSDFGAVPPAVLQRSLFVEPGGGNVTVQPSGAGSFLPLREEDIVPNGSQVDATRGTLSLFVARTAAGDQINAQVYAGPFTMRQLAGGASLHGVPGHPAHRLPAHRQRTRVALVRSAPGRGLRPAPPPARVGPRPRWTLAHPVRARSPRRRSGRAG